MQKITIDTDIQPPANKSRKDPLYPWLSMKVGDSFVVEGRVAAASARGSFRRYQRMGLIPRTMSVAQRSEEDNFGDKSVRLWLVEGEKQ